MKRSFYAIGIAMLVAFQAIGQTSETAKLSTLPIDNHKYVVPNDIAVNDFAAPAGIEQQFRADFSNITDVQWMETANGYRVHFMKDAFLTAVDYTKKGKLYSTIRYGDDLLSKSQKNQLVLNLDEANIRQVCEVKMAGTATRVYVVIVEDRNSVKTVQMLDGDITVLQQELKKG
jgi:hypothetical protein